jgi:hypothetical protein
MSENTIPDLDDALDMELGVEDEQDISKVPDRIRIVLIVVGEALIMAGIFLIVLGMYQDVIEAIIAGIVLILSAIFICVIPMVALEIKKYQYAADLSAVDSQTQMQDYDWWEQIDVEEKELVMIPAYTLDNKEITWEEEVIDSTIGTLKQAVQRVGGRSQLNPTVLDQIVDARLEEIVHQQQEYNMFQRIGLWLLRVRPRTIPVDFKKLAEDWISFTVDRQGMSVRSRVGFFQLQYDTYMDKDGEIAIAPTERFETETFGRYEEEDKRGYEEISCGTKAWEVKEIRLFEREQREQNRGRFRFRKSDDSTIREPEDDEGRFWSRFRRGRDSS